jgi:hypothetical protein
MAEPINCPSCQKQLWVSPDIHLAWLTCPRCLALIANPAAQAHAQAESPPDVTVPTPSVPESAAREVGGVERLPSISLPAARPPAGTECPGCGKPTSPQWVFCPFCERPLRSPRGGAVDTVARGDTRRTHGAIWLLAVLGGFGVLAALFAATSALAQGETQGILVMLVAFLGLFGISTLVTLRRSKGDSKSRGTGRIFFNALTLFGGIIFASAVVGFALVVFAFVVCLTNSGSRC